MQEGLHGHRRYRRRKTYALLAERHRARAGLVGPRLFDLRLPVHQRGHAGPGRIRLSGRLPERSAAHRGARRRGMGLVPRHRLLRAGRHHPAGRGDYVWQSRILGSGIGFVIAATAWWFILWLWAPIYGAVLAEQFFQPLWATLGSPSGATWFASHNGVFVVTLITIALASLAVSLGMSGYAKLQKWGFYAGLVGIAVIVILLLVNSKSDFIAAFDSNASRIFGINNAYAGTLADAAKAGYTPPPFGVGGSFSASMLLVPMLMFYLLWPNWGTTLYGEVRGASDFRRVASGMFIGLWITVALSVVLLALFAKTFGFDFYQSANAMWLAGSTHALPIFPYPALLAGWLVNNTAFQTILLLVMSVWFFAWVGTLFLSSTRVIFAAAFDRILPDGAASVSEKRRVPVWSLVLMMLPAVGLGAL